MGTRIDQIAPDLYRLSTYIAKFDLQFNRFLVTDDEPLLYHTGMKGMFPLVRNAVAKIIAPGSPIVRTTLVLLLLFAPLAATAAPVAPNGISLSPDYLSWQLVAPSFREDKGHIRVITGNPIAVAALRAGTNPLPDGSILAKVVWKAQKHPAFPVATVPGDFVQVEFMVKDAAKYRATGGWGFARFVGNDLTPYGKDASFVNECFACHTPVAPNDYLFTHMVKAP